MRGVKYLASAVIAGMTDVVCLFAYGTPVRSSRFLSPNQQSGRHRCITRGQCPRAEVVKFDGEPAVGPITHRGLVTAIWTETALTQ